MNLVSFSLKRLSKLVYSQVYEKYVSCVMFVVCMEGDEMRKKAEKPLSTCS